MATLVDRTENPGSGQPARKKMSTSAIILVIGLAIFAIPTLLFVIRESWSNEAGAHGPIVFATGLWLLHRHGNGSENDGLGRGFMHLIGGSAAINIKTMAIIYANTFKVTAALTVLCIG